MLCYSTRNNSMRVSFKEAVIEGLALDGGLYLPEEIPVFDKSYYDNLSHKSFQQISFEIAEKFLSDEIPGGELSTIINESINFPAPVIHLNGRYFVLELFHGPTLAFKDFGARFMARLLGYFIKDMNRELNILVATSGDTGSAVASGFYNVEGINVHVLYPKGRVSEFQEMQLTTYGSNIHALEVEGSFDDCQKLVKAAFSDNELKSRLNISSANSINIARLLPQSFYYVNAYKEFAGKNEAVIFSVPSGNLGNLTAGVIAKKMGLPVKSFISATNRNDVFTEYINTGKFVPRASVKTLSNAMDVGNPSNFERLHSIYGNKKLMAEDILSFTFSDEETLSSIKEIYNNSGYIIDPHGAVGYLAAKKVDDPSANYIVLETAHYSKFHQTVEHALNIKCEIPERLKSCIDKKKQSIVIQPDFKNFKAYLLD